MESKKIVTGIKWAGIQFALDAVFRFSIRLILARLLLPEQFGLIGMCMVFISVAGAASELGIGEALIQKKNDARVKLMFSTAFWSGIAWGLGLYLLMSFVVGPFVAYFYEEPLLIKIIPALSIGIFLKPFTTIHMVILTRRMNFKKIAKAFNTASLVAGIIAIGAAYIDFGVWALVINNVLAAVLALPLLLKSTKWIPSWEWKKMYFKEIFGFGAYSSGTRIFSTLTYNIDNLIIGKMLGASFLGAYTLAFSLTENLRQMLSSVLNKVMYPVFGKNQDDKLKLKGYFLKIINLNAFAIYPIMAFFLVFAEEIILTLFGDKWEMAILPLQILSVAMMVHLLVNSFTSIIRGLGKPKLELKIIMGLNIFVLLPGLYLGTMYFGLVGATYAVVLHKIGLVISAVTILDKEIDLKFTEIFRAVRNPILMITACVIIIETIFHFTVLKNVMLLAAIYGILYIFIAYRTEKRMITQLIEKLK